MSKRNRPKRTRQPNGPWVVGDKVDAWYQGMDCGWFPGTITAQSAQAGNFTITFNDRDIQEKTPASCLSLRPILAALKLQEHIEVFNSTTQGGDWVSGAVMGFPSGGMQVQFGQGSTLVTLPDRHRNGRKTTFGNLRDNNSDEGDINSREPVGISLLGRIRRPTADDAGNRGKRRRQCA